LISFFLISELSKKAGAVIEPLDVIVLVPNDSCPPETPFIFGVITSV
jgi:hypothetical protein